MYQFLCLFAPGMLAWLVSLRYARTDAEQVKKEGVLLAAAKVAAYAMADLTVVAAVLHPLGRMQFVVLPDGTMTVQYGVSALVVAVAAGVGIGVCAAVVEKKL